MIRSECERRRITEIDCQTGRISMTVIRQDFWHEHLIEGKPCPGLWIITIHPNVAEFKESDITQEMLR